MREIGHATYQRDIETTKPVQYKHQQKKQIKQHDVNTDYSLLFLLAPQVL